MLSEGVGGLGKRGKAFHSLLSLKRLVIEVHPGAMPSRGKTCFPEGTGPMHVQWVQRGTPPPAALTSAQGQAPAALSQQLRLCMGASWVEKKTPERLVLGPQTIL